MSSPLVQAGPPRVAGVRARRGPRAGALALLLAAASLAAAGCRDDAPPVVAPPAAEASPAPAGDAARTTWLFIGDSLTAGYGVAPDEAYVAHLGRAFAARGLPWTVRNAGVSGDTSAGVLRRVDWLATPDVHTALLCVGANDGLRGQPVAALEANLSETIRRLQGRGIRVVLAGMRVPPNYGDAYARDFHAAYGKVAAALGVPLLPFLLDGVAGVASLNLPDGIHPNPDGHARIAEAVLAFLDREGLLNAD